MYKIRRSVDFTLLADDARSDVGGRHACLQHLPIMRQLTLPRVASLWLVCASLPLVFPRSAVAQWPRDVPADGIAGYPKFFPDGRRIAFAFLSGPDAVSQLHSIRIDGTDERTLTAEQVHVLEVEFSRDGTRLVYRTTRRRTRPDDPRAEGLVSIKPDGTDSRVIATVPDGRLSMAGWSPDGKALLVMMRAGRGPDSVYLMNADGSNRRAVFEGSGRWLSDGIVIQTSRSMTGAQILVRESATSPGRSLSDMPFQFNMVASRDGRLVALQAGSAPPSGPGGGGQLYIMKRDGTGLRKVVDDASHIFNMSFSPDGSKLLFEDTRQNNTDLFVINVDGTGEHRLTTAPEDDAQPSWSPDGRQILFSSGHHVWLMNADGTAKRRIR